MARSRGRIERLPSGALRARVYAGKDPVSGRRHYLTEFIDAGPKAEVLAEKARIRLLSQVDERRNPRTRATVAQLLERHLKMLDVAPTTLSGYRGYVQHHIKPLIGDVKVGALDPEILDSLYVELRRCQHHCRGRSYTQHRTDQEHACDHRCQPHKCEPLSAATVRQIHFLLNGAFKRAVRWRWVAVNPIEQAEPPRAPKPDPRPPTAAEAARIVEGAWEDPDWGAFIWLAMTTGARRGELCALQWKEVGLDAGVLVLRQSVAKDERARWHVKDTKTHQQRRVALDQETIEILVQHRKRCEERVAALGTQVAPEAFVFSQAPDHSAFLLPESVSQRYGRLVRRLGIDTDLHALRHYSATELIMAGVDVRTVAGRLGHSGGGITTLRVYSAWREEADQRAASALSARMPARPRPADLAERAKREPRTPYEKIAARLRSDIRDATLRPGDELPTVAELAVQYDVSNGTAQRAMALLRTEGLIEVARGRRATVVGPALDNGDVYGSW